MKDQLGSFTNADHRTASISKVQASWDGWVGTIEALSNDQVHQANTCGHWSVKDLIGHVAAWDGMALDKIEAILAYRERETSGETADAFNARTAQEFQDVGLDALLSRMHQTHARLIDTLGGLVDVSEERFGVIEWAIAEDTWQHYDEHRRQVADRFLG